MYPSTLSSCVWCDPTLVTVPLVTCNSRRHIATDRASYTMNPCMLLVWMPVYPVWVIFQYILYVVVFPNMSFVAQYIFQNSPQAGPSQPQEIYNTVSLDPHWSPCVLWCMFYSILYSIAARRYLTLMGLGVHLFTANTASVSPPHSSSYFSGLWQYPCDAFLNTPPPHASPSLASLHVIVI